MAGAVPTPIRLLHQFFDASVGRYPDRIAVDVPPGPGRPDRVTVTYRELRDQADSLAASLRGYVAADGVVAVLLPRNSHRLYVAQLAVLKAGGAFTCIDPSFPDGHIRAILDDGEVSILLTDRGGLERIGDAGIRVSRAIDVGEVAVAEVGSTGVGAVETPPQNLAYVIYTSGTTGAPKGVMIEHRSIVNLVASDIEEFGLTPLDRVGQGSSAAYDSSIEEIWLAFAAGATLVVLDDHTSRLGPDLVPWLRSERITVFCPPPTLLRTTGCDDPESALPDLRLLYVGGEALTEDLAARWGRGRRLVNGYGPTECTVTVVRGDVLPGLPVTIGTPVPGHTAWVVDGELNEVEEGKAGELCLGGVGLARGYRNRDDVTREKFPVHPALGRIYRTGDLVKRGPDGQLVYMGRIDAQVKLRGYRIELEAIEAHLARCVGVREAACRVQGEGAGALLAAHIVPSDTGAPPSFATIKDELRRSLPAYMIPARIGLVNSLPRSVGGKVDRKNLKDLAADATEAAGVFVGTQNSIEAAVIAAFASALRTNSPISTRDDFFVDLGGDSLSAVGVICALRRDAATAAVTTRDLYEVRTAEMLAARLPTSPTRSPTSGATPSSSRLHAARPMWVTLAQGCWLLLGVTVFGGAAYLIVFELVPALLERIGLWGSLLLEIPLVLAGVCGYAVLAVFTTLILKLALIGEYRPIRTPVWSGLYLRHWIVQSAARAIPWGLFAETVAYGAVLRLLGAKVGRRVHVHRGVNLNQGGWDLLTLGDDVTLCRDAHLGLVTLDSGCLCIGPVTIGDGATLEIRAGVGAHTTIEREGYLTALSWLADGATVLKGERWGGVPARHVGPAPTAPKTDGNGRVQPVLHAVVQIASAVLMRVGIGIPALLACAAISVTAGFNAQEVAAWLLHPSWTVGASIMVVLTAVAMVPIWLVFRGLAVRFVGTIKPSVINRWSLAYIRVWYKTSEVESVGAWLTGTLFWPLWLRLAGMKIGSNCEISTITDVVPENLHVGPESFFADGIYLGAPQIHRGTVAVRETIIGRGTFLGNHVVIPSGANLPNDLFVGVCTVADGVMTRAGSSWFGNPPLELPRREVVSIDRRLTHNPGPLRYCTRLFWESMRFTLPVLPMVVGSGWLWVVTNVGGSGPWAALVMAPALTFAAMVAECLAVVMFKWLLLGRAHAGQHALWSCWCSRWDFLYVVWQFYALPLLAAIEGTQFLTAYLRAMGARIGRRVVLGPGLGQVADPDMIIIEDEATVCANYQAHSFEDRVLKLAPVVVRKGATVGESAVVFYGADIGEDATVSANSVVMKNERLERSAAYSGCPVQPYEAMAVDARGERADAAAAFGLRSERHSFLDVARGLAVAGMIFMHFVPSESTSVGAVWAMLSQFLQGKSAALFCVLAGAAWEIQASRAGAATRSRWYFARRGLVLAAAGVMLHVFAWPTEILVPLAAMMAATIGLRAMGRRVVLGAVVLLLAMAPMVPAFFGHYVEGDWNEDGGHVTDSALGWATIRALVFDGNYPLVPWLAFPLVGILMAQRLRTLRSVKMWFGWAMIVFTVAQAWEMWADANKDSLGGAWAYLGSTWVPTSVPFVLVSGAFAVAVVCAFAGRAAVMRPGRVIKAAASVGRASLTHYVLHICVLYVPLRAFLGHDEWSVGVGLCAWIGYLLAAVPLSVLWFRRHKRGPAEAVWAMLSGR